MNPLYNEAIMTGERKKTILLVEDEAFIGMAESMSLGNYGYEITHVLSGEEAIDTINADPHRFDLVLMDIDLGKGIDGTITAGEILKNHDIPVVFLSAHSEKEIVQKTENISSYGYVTKNSGITVLDASIKMAFKLFEANRTTESHREQLRTILNSIGDGVIATDTDRKIIKMNPVAEKLTGWESSQAEGKPLSDVYHIRHARTGEPVSDPVDIVLRTGKSAESTDHTILASKDGNEYYISDSGSPIINASGNITGATLIFRDITQEHIARKKIESSEASLNEAQRIAKIGNWEYHFHPPEGTWSKESYSIFELDDDIPENEISMTIRNRIHADDKPGVIDAISRAIDNGENFTSEFRAVFDDGRIKQIGCLGEAIRDATGTITGYRGTYQDITERKNTEEALHTLDSELNLIFRNMLNAFVIWESVFNEKGEFISFRFGFFNEAFTRISKLKLEDVRGRDVFDVWPGTELPWVEHYGRVAVTGVPHIFDLYHEPTKGWYHCNAYRPTESKSRICVIFEDITERKKSEETLGQKTALLEAQLNSSIDGILIVDSLQRIILRNSKFVELFRIPEHFTMNSDDRPQLQHVTNQMKNPFQFIEKVEFLYSHPEEKTRDELEMNDGTVLERYSYPVLGKDGTNYGRIWTFRNISEQKALEHERFQLLDIIEKSLNEIYVFNSETLRFEFVNHGALQNLGYTSEEIKNMTPVDIKPEFTESSFMNLVKPLVHGEMADLVFNTFHRRKDGSDYPVDVHLQLFRQEDKSVFLAIINDITDRKKAEDEIQALLNEKKIILKEVHHRIKNNMNTICSMLNIQAKADVTGSSKSILQSAANRIRSMMMLYDKLYRSESNVSISVKKFLPPLIDEIIGVYTDSPAVKAVIRVDDIILNARVLSSLGLIINELITNAVKYAFHGRKDGRITVTVKKHDAHVVIVFEDNGSGMPGSISPDTTSGFGLQLIGILVQQIQGSLHIENRDGTRFVIEFTP